MNDKILISADTYFLLHFYNTSIIYYNAAVIYLPSTPGLSKCQVGVKFHFCLLLCVLILAIFISLNDARIFSLQLNGLLLKSAKNVGYFGKHVKIIHDNLIKKYGRINPNKPLTFVLFSLFKIFCTNNTRSFCQ